MVNQPHYRWDFIGLSTDEKPMPATDNRVVDGSTYYCSDTSKLYVFYKEQWYERKPLGGGGGGTSDYSDLSNKPKINNVELVGDKSLEDLGIQPASTEHQILGWTKLEDDTFQELDLNPQINEGAKRFTILVYIRKGSIRVGVKYELTLSELTKLMSKAQKNMLCIVRMVCDPYNNNEFAMLRQCVQAKLDGNGNIIPNVINIKYSLINKNGAVITGLDNYEWCFYAE